MAWFLFGRDFRRRRRRMRVFWLTILSGAFLFLLLWVVWQIGTLVIRKDVYIFHAPAGAVYNVVESPRHLRQWFPCGELLSCTVDSINEAEMYVRYRGRRYVIHSGRRRAGRYLEKKISDAVTGKEVFRVEWRFERKGDTITAAQVDFKGQFPFVSTSLNSGFLPKGHIPALMDSLHYYIESRKRSYVFDRPGRLRRAEAVPFLYLPYEGREGLSDRFNEDLAPLLIWAIEQGVYRHGDKPFMCLYPASDGEAPLDSFRNCVPLRRLPGPMPPDYRIDTLESASYYGLTFRGDYDFLDYTWIRARSLLPDTLRIDRTRPVLIRFNKGHSRSSDPAQWETEILFPLQYD
ncbi:MAG: hypothetical protein GXO27_05085 [Chlorobi bacterium]|nr:hypothetical protein [Chlorobiota bacterium]